MNDRSHLFDGEKLLCIMRPSWLMLVSSYVQGAIILGVLGFLTFFFLQSAWAIVGFSVVFLLFCFQKWRVWRVATFRITNQRILLLLPGGIIVKKSPKAIRWDRYQESDVRGGLIGTLTGSKTLLIHFGTPGAENHYAYPFLPYAGDLKHYLDKVDASVRGGTVGEVREFVAKKHGKRY